MAKSMTKSELIGRIADSIDGLNKKHVKVILDVIGEVVIEALNESDEGQSVPILPGLVSVKKTWKKAVKARRGISPFTGEETTFKAKKAHWVIKARVGKKLKESVS